VTQALFLGLKITIVFQQRKGEDDPARQACATQYVSGMPTIF
jgi:hypothetical protein